MMEQHLKVLRRALKKFGLSDIKNIINGKEVAAKSKHTFDNHTPIDDAFIGKVAASDAKDIDQATKAAQKAFADWRNWPHQQRKKCLYAIADEIEKYKLELAVLESYDTEQLRELVNFDLLRVDTLKLIRATFSLDVLAIDGYLRSLWPGRQVCLY